MVNADRPVNLRTPKASQADFMTAVNNASQAALRGTLCSLDETAWRFLPPPLLVIT
jgi:hypothetical protein